MSFFGAVGSALATGLGKGAASVASSALGNSLGLPHNYLFNKKDRRDSAKVDFEQYKKQRIFDYQFDSTLGLDLARLYDSKDFDLARRYGENTASWAVEGLRRAGLNPILAAGNGFNASLGFQGQGSTGGSSVPHTSGNSYNSNYDKIDFTGNPLLASSLDVQSSTAAKLKADSELSHAQSNVAQANADNIKAQTLGTYIKAINDARTGGVSSIGGLISSGLSDLIGDGSATKGANALLNSRLYPIEGVNSLKHSGITPTNRNSPPSNASQPKKWLSDLSTAKDLANEVSPSPFTIPTGRDSYFRPKSPQEKERERRLENGRKERGRIEFNNRKFGSVFKH